MSAPPRPIEAFVHGLSGPIGMLEGREAMALLSFPGLDAYQREHRGADTYLDRAVAKLRLLSAAYRADAGRVVATRPVELAQPVPLSGRQLTTGQVANLRGVTPSAVTKAIREHRLRAEWFAGRWLIDPGDAAQYRTS